MELNDLIGDDDEDTMNQENQQKSLTKLKLDKMIEDQKKAEANNNNNTTTAA